VEACLGLPLAADRDRELVGDLAEGHLAAQARPDAPSAGSATTVPAKVASVNARYRNPNRSDLDVLMATIVTDGDA